MKNKMSRQDQADSLRDEVEKASAEKLPSRSEIHAEKRNSMKWKFNFPIVRLLGIAFLLIPITILALHFNNKEDSVLKSLFPVNQRVESYDQINIRTNKDPAKSTESMEFDRKKEDENGEGELSGGEKQEVASVETINTEAQTGSGKVTPTEAKPEPPTVVEQEKKEEVVQEENVEFIEHVVASGETLYRISMKYYNSRSGEEIISEYNNLKNNQVNEGQRLTIPIKRNE